MTVCVTGDVHHMSLETKDQAYMDRTELEVAIEYARLAGEYDVPVTLFVTGKAAAEEPERVERLAAMEHVEIGGHGYYAFDTPVHKAWRGLEKVSGGMVGSWNGPSRFQQWEINRTKRQFAALDVQITSWRDHAYRHDEHTSEHLANLGFTHLSDRVGPNERVKQAGELIDVPINTPPDHEHVFHGFRKPGSDAVQGFSGPFGGNSVAPDEWCDWVLEEIASIHTDGGRTTVLAHPSCMCIANEFSTFEQLCRTLKEYDCTPMRDITLGGG